MRLLNHLDLNYLELRNSKLHILSAPPTASSGMFYFNSNGDNNINIYNGTRWMKPLVHGINGDLTVTDVETHRLINVVDPVNAQDAATKNYVDNAVQGLDAKASVRGAVSTNITLAGGAPLVIDTSITLVVGNRVLVKGQTLAQQNGIYVVTTVGTGSNGTWTRAADMSVWAEVPNSYVWVEEGTLLQDTGWVCTANTGGTLDTTAITWVQFSAASGGTTASNTGTLGQGVFDAKSGTDLQFRNLSSPNAKLGITLDDANNNIIFTIAEANFGTVPTATSATSATTATHVAGGAAGSLVYQTGAGATTTLALSAATHVLIGGATAPTWTPISGLSIGTATNASNLAITNVDTAGDFYIPFTSSTTGNAAFSVDATTTILKYNPGTSTLSCSVGSFSSSLNTPTINAIGTDGFLFNNVTSGQVSIGDAVTSGMVSIANGTVFAGTVSIASGVAGGNARTVTIGTGGGITTIGLGSAAASGVTTIYSPTVKLPNVSGASAGFVKKAADGTLSVDTATYGTGTVKKYYTLIAADTNRTLTANVFVCTATAHGFGATTQLVTQVQVANAAAGTVGELVLVDTVVAANGDVTVTFANNPTSGHYSLVILG